MAIPHDKQQKRPDVVKAGILLHKVEKSSGFVMNAVAVAARRSPQFAWTSGACLAKADAVWVAAAAGGPNRPAGAACLRASANSAWLQWLEKTGRVQERSFVGSVA